MAGRPQSKVVVFVFVVPRPNYVGIGASQTTRASSCSRNSFDAHVMAPANTASCDAYFQRKPDGTYDRLAARNANGELGHAGEAESGDRGERSQHRQMRSAGSVCPCGFATFSDSGTERGIGEDSPKLSRQD